MSVHFSCVSPLPPHAKVGSGRALGVARWVSLALLVLLALSLWGRVSSAAAAADLSASLHEIERHETGVETPYGQGRLAFDPGSSHLYLAHGADLPYFAGTFYCNCEGALDELDLHGKLLRRIGPAPNGCARMDSVAVTATDLYTINDMTQKLCRFDKASGSLVSSVTPEGAGQFDTYELEEIPFDRLTALTTGRNESLLIGIKDNSDWTLEDGFHQCTISDATWAFCGAHHVIREIPGLDFKVNSPEDIAATGSQIYALQRTATNVRKVISVLGGATPTLDPPAYDVHAIASDDFGHVWAVGLPDGGSDSHLALWEIDASTGEEVGYCVINPANAGCGGDPNARYEFAGPREYGYVSKAEDIAVDRSGHVYVLAERTSFNGGADIAELWRLGPRDPLAGVNLNAPHGFTWKMADRYDGDDHDRDGLADYFTGTHPAHFPPWPKGVSGAATEVAPSLWRVDMTAQAPCGKSTEVDWVIDGTYLAEGHGCKASYYFPASGSRTHTIALSYGDEVVETKKVVLKDWLIVSLGDSYASGEGVPDVPKKKGPHGRTLWEDKQCHRSAEAATSLAAARVENADPHSSVTFVHLACSGAAIGRGLLGSYPGSAPDASSKHPKPPQLDELKRLLHGRRPDVVLLSIGGNDVGFGDIIVGCVKEDDCPHDGAGRTFRKKVKELPGKYNELAGRLKAVVRSSPVLITQYPDATHDDRGRVCGSHGTKQMLWDNPAVGLLSPFEISRDEAEWASKVVGARLNRAVERAAAAAGWTAVGSHLPRFFRHGYCAHSHWLTQYDEANRLQERVPASTAPDAAPGTMHPNSKGQRAYAKAISAALKRKGLPG